MNIRYENNQHKIEPTLDRRIIKRFIDFETGHLIVYELGNTQEGKKAIYTTVFDQENKQIITPEERKEIINKYERKIDSHPFKLISVRKINILTGKETIEETLTNVETQEIIASRKRDAFDEKEIKNLLQWYFDEINAEKTERYTLNDDSLDEKKREWFQGLYLAMRMQGEATGNEFTVFRPDSYKRWQKLEPEIEEILDYIIDALSKLYGEEVRIDINRRLGRLAKE